MLRVVFDTNILFSAIGWRGAPWECLQLARTNKVEAFTCRQILAELREKLLSKLLMSDMDSDRAITEILLATQWVEVNEVAAVVVDDPDDDAVVACALIGGATHIVSGDRHLLSLKEFQGIQIIQARELLDQLPH